MLDDDLLDIETFISDYRERSWMEQAACKGMDTNIFFPKKGIPSTASLARKICSGCEVQQECKEYGAKEKFGFWGNTSVMQRRAIRKSSRKS